MTGGQMAPTTMIGQKTATTVTGRDPVFHGHPLKISTLLAQLPGVKYIERVGLFAPAEVVKAKKAIRQAFENQINGVGFSLVEVLSACPTYWGKTPQQSMAWIKDEMTKEYPLGRLK
jgi:2-oxoglutarate ferredoxin oxidoreductase subunit beta